MALTVVLKPSGFEPVGGGSLIYQMTEASIAGKPNYRVQFQFNGYTSTLPIFEFRLDASLTLNADIAPILRSLLKMSETTNQRFLNTYVKYQAIWDGGSDAQVNLSGDVIYFYIGNNNILNSRSVFHVTSANNGPYLVPTISSGLNAGLPILYTWLGRTAYIDFLHDSSLSVDSFVRIQSSNPAAGAVTIPDVASRFAGNVNNLESINFKPYYGTVAQISSMSGKMVINDSDFTNTYKIYFGSADISNGIAQTFTAPSSQVGSFVMIKVSKVGSPTNSITIKVLGTTAGLPNEADVKQTTTYDLRSIGGGMNYIIHTLPTIINATVYAIQIIPNNDGVNDASNYYAMYTSAASTYASGSLSLKGGGWVNDANKDFAMIQMQTQVFAGTYLFMSQKTESDNPIYLKWLNDLGGISTWMFDFNQIYGVDARNFGRYKTLELFSQNLPLDAWQMIADLARQGVDYGDNLKSGQYVQDFTNESSLLPVFITPKQLSTTTRKIQSTIQITARYQLAPNTMM